MKTAEAEFVHFRTHAATASDGTRLRYFDSEEVALPAILLANGLGGPVSAWRPYFERWRRQYRVLSWDYRGLYGSLLPHRGASLHVSEHARDVATILDAAGVERCVVVGWSMGVQVGLEFFTQARERVSHLVLINGTYGAPLAGVPLPFSHVTLPPLVRRARGLHRVGERLIRAARRLPHSYSMVRALGLIGAGIERAHFYELLADFEEVNMDVYLDLLSHLHEHDAEEELRHVDIPTLVVAGSRDLITPPWLARRIATEIRGAQFYVVPGGTHYSAAEQPSLIAGRIEQFLGSPPPH